MSIKVWRQGAGYMAEVTPPESKDGVQATNAPHTREEMSALLDRIGVHTQDLWDAISEADCH